MEVFQMTPQPTAHHLRKSKIPYSLEFLSEKDNALRLMAGRVHSPKVVFSDSWIQGCSAF